MKTTRVNVIFWKYYDNSASGVVRVYKDSEVAESDLAMLRMNCAGARIFELIEVDYIES